MMATRVTKLSVEQLPQLYQLRLQAYAVEAKLLGVEYLPPMTQALSDFIKEPDRHWGIFGANQLQAGISCDGNQITSLVVHPNYFRQGLASQLLSHVLPRQAYWLVMTGAANTPALLLYQKHGFTLSKRFEVEGLELVELHKSNN
ncbi:GNAT family N-acetyltransferase [Salinibius halmophilus]|uniref:GNAT family N-acetyltransferase n=1 Tax=Salinibius halmophilus TaxID=1853216 RepID=UPI000E665E54|nr:GNAT family N-acetyltransferase [Salinibius halmophilus]